MGRVNDQPNPSQPRPAADAEVSEEDLRAQWQDLADRIRAAREAYYGGDTQLMSDAAFDELLRDLQALETTHPFLQRDESPTTEARRGRGTLVEVGCRVRRVAPGPAGTGDHPPVPAAG